MRASSARSLVFPKGTGRLDRVQRLEAWDSLTHLKIVSRIGAFSIELEVDDIISIENFGKAKDIVGVHNRMKVPM